ncbi:MAG TPA: hypothetical protein VGE24_03100 [Emticicia sp.]
MKRIFTLLLCSFCSLSLIGQSVTISPSSSLLPPSMSRAQRQAIASPANGLLVFQHTTEPNSAKGYYWYNGTAWLRLTEVDDLGWTIFNENVHSVSSMNVGIGTTLPTDKLHLRTPTASAGFTFEGVNPTFQFKQKNPAGSTFVEKGFIQLADNDLRIGINSSNTTGKFIIRTHGADQIEVDGSGGGGKMLFNYGGTNVGFVSPSSSGNLHIGTSSGNNADFVGLNGAMFVTNGGRIGIGTSNPQERLDVQGNLKLLGSIAMAGEITKTNVAEGSFLPLCYGRVGFSGDHQSGSSNFTCENPSTGRYKIYNPSIVYTSTIIVTLNSSNAQIVASAGCGTGECTVYLKDAFSNENRFDPINQAFYFVIYR